MLVYSILFFVSILLSLYELRANGVPRFLRFLLGLFFLVLLCFRSDVGNDYHNYVDIYSNPSGYIGVFEPGFFGLVKLFVSLGFGHQMIFLCCGMLSFLPVAFVVQKTVPKMFCTAMSVYACSYVFFESMNTMRQAVAMAAFLLAVYYFVVLKKKAAPIIILIVGLSFHFSLAFILVIAFCVAKLYKKINRVTMAVLLLASLIIGQFLYLFFDLINYIAGFGGVNLGYLDSFEQRGVSSGTFLIYLNISAVYLLVRHKKLFVSSDHFVRIVTYFYFFSVLIYNVFIKFYIGLRFYWYFYLFVILLIPFILLRVKKMGSRLLSYLLLILIMTVYTIVSLQTEYYQTYRFNFSLF